MKVTLGWDCKPTTTDDGIHVLPRRAEDLLRAEYYPNGSGTWPVDPLTGDKLPMEEIVKQPRYFQTWMYVSKVRRWPVIGQLLSNTLQFFCGLRGHEVSKTEWGYGGGDRCDVWCRWCNHSWQVPKSVIQFQHKDTAYLMQDVGKEVDA